MSSASLPALSPTAAALLATYPAGINAELARACALHGVTADQFHFHASDVRIGCPSRALAVTLKTAGSWRSMADVYQTNPEHPDAKRWPWGCDVPFARLDHLVNENHAAREGAKPVKISKLAEAAKRTTATREQVKAAGDRAFAKASAAGASPEQAAKAAQIAEAAVIVAGLPAREVRKILSKR